MSQIAIEKIQRGLEAAGSGVPSDGTLVPATYQISGDGTMQFLDRVVFPKYARGYFGGVVEDVYVAETGTELSLNDRELTAEELVWDLNHAVKAVPGAATSFDFALPTTAANSIRAFTYEFVAGGQEYEFGYGMFSEYNIHADGGDNGGTFFCNGKVVGRKAAASTVTASLGLVANREVMNLRQCTVFLDALGTAAGAAAASTLKLKGFTWNLKTGWMGEGFATGRTAKDFSDGYFHGYELTGTLKCLADSAAITQIATMRAGTGKVMRVKWLGSATRSVNFDFPVAFMGITGIGNENNEGLRMVTFNYSIGYSVTSTAQGPTVQSTLSGSTIVT